MSEIQRIINEKDRVANIHTTTHDLKEEIDNIKNKIINLKSNNMILDKRISNLEDQSLVTGPIDNRRDTQKEGFLYTLEVITHQNFTQKLLFNLILIIRDNVRLLLIVGQTLIVYKKV